MYMYVCVVSIYTCVVCMYLCAWFVYICVVCVVCVSYMYVCLCTCVWFVYMCMCVWIVCVYVLCLCVECVVYVCMFDLCMCVYNSSGFFLYIVISSVNKFAFSLDLDALLALLLLHCIAGSSSKILTRVARVALLFFSQSFIFRDRDTICRKSIVFCPDCSLHKKC